MTESDTIQDRGNIAKLLAACFCEPDKPLFIDHQVCENLTALLGRCLPHAADASAEMAKQLVLLDQTRMSVDHAALFIGPFELLAAPYGSVYEDDKRRLMGESTVLAQRFYEQAGLSLDIQEPADHIAIELEFMSYLCKQEAQALAEDTPDLAEKYRGLQTEFFKRCLEPWVFRFCTAIKEGSTNAFYIALADCLDRFMQSCSRLYLAETSQTV